MKDKLRITNYQKHWTEATPRGHRIRICHGEQGEHVTVIDLEHQHKTRDHSGRWIKQHPLA